VFISEQGEMIQSLIMKHSYGIRDALIIKYDVKPYDHKPVKEYYVATVLDEVIRFCTSLIRWEDDFKDGFDEKIEKTHLGNLIIQALNNEFNMYYRKFIEALINLTLWKQLNDDLYYEYYYLLDEYENLNYKKSDLNEFYGIVPTETENMITDVENKIVQIFSKIDESKCFFITQNPRNRVNIQGINIIVRSSSMKDRLKKALLNASLLEKLLLGLSYERYSDSSEKIHLISHSSMFDHNLLLNMLDFTFVMMNSIVSSCANILGLSDIEQISSMDNILSKLSISRGWYTTLFEDIYDIDDYVYNDNGVLGRVIDKTVSPYGYRSYKVLHLSEKPNAVEEEQYPAHYIKRIQPKEKLLQMVFETLPEFKQEYDNNPDETFLAKSLDKSMIMLWGITLKKRLTNID